MLGHYTTSPISTFIISQNPFSFNGFAVGVFFDTMIIYLGGLMDEITTPGQTNPTTVSNINEEQTDTGQSQTIQSQIAQAPLAEESVQSITEPQTRVNQTQLAEQPAQPQPTAEQVPPSMNASLVSETVTPEKAREALANTPVADQPIFEDKKTGKKSISPFTWLIAGLVVLAGLGLLMWFFA
jgi:hypothetical protein